MLKGVDLIGKPVVAFDTGEQFDTVEDIVFDQHSGHVLALLVDEGGWFSSTNVILWNDIQAIGPDAIIVNSKVAEISADQVPEVKQILEHDKSVKGTKMMTTDGCELGTLIDLYFDEQTGQIEGFEVSSSAFADAYSGYAFIPAPTTLQIGQHIIFVPPETMPVIEEQAGGIKAALPIANIQEAGTTTNAAVDPAEQKPFVIGKIVAEDVAAPDGTLLVTAGQTITPMVAEEAEHQGVLDKLYQAAGGSHTAGMSSASRDEYTEQTIAQIKGRRVQRAVKTDRGVVIAAPGQIVTNRVIERAQTYHKEQELLEATGLSMTTAAQSSATIDATDDRTGATTQAAGDELREGVMQVGHTANLWGHIKEVISDVKERSAQEREEQRIKGALGRPVDRVILDRQDNIILNVGELITNRSIERARQAGVLDILLSSVYTKAPELLPEELRASASGDASLESNRM